MSLRLRCGAVVAVGLVLTGCGTPKAPLQGVDGQAEISSSLPIAIPGVEPCSTLSQASGRAADGGGLPSLALPCLTETGRIDLASLGDTPTLVNLWATWCGPCREEMPILQAAYEDAGDAVQFVGIDTKDSPREAAEFLAEVEVTYPQLVDGDGSLLAHTRVPGLPVTLLYDEDGNEVARHIGPLSTEELEDLLDGV